MKGKDCMYKGSADGCWNCSNFEECNSIEKVNEEEDKEEK